MGAPDAALGVYMNDMDRIRSVLEYYLGRKLPEDWQCRELRGLYSARNAKEKLTHRQRDFIGEVYAWGRSFLLGLENQEKINLTFPWRLMELDCLAYRQEIEEISERNQVLGESCEEIGECSERKQEIARFYGEADDFMYRFGSTDRVKPILNLTLYWGKKKWKSPHSLREMMEDISNLPQELRQLAGDYRVHIISMREIPEEALQEMDSDLKYVLGIMKRTRSARKYGAYIQENRDYFSRIPRSAPDVIDACTNLKNVRKYLQSVREDGKNEEELDMCYAWNQMQRNAKKEGILLRLVTQVCKKMSLGQSLEKIAEDLVEEVSAIELIYNTAKKYAPTYNPETVLKELAAET